MKLSKHYNFQKNKLLVVGIITAFALISVFGLSLITGNNNQTNIGYSNASSTEPADINNDNKVDIFDLSILLSKWNTNDSTSDLNNDNIVNVFDLSVLLSKWGSVTTQPIFTPSTFNDAGVKNAITQARNAGGGIVQLNSGTYNFSAVVYLDCENLTIQGKQDGSTIIKMVGALDSAFQSSSAAVRGNTVIKDITFDMSGATGSYAQAIDLNTNTTSGLIDNLVIYGANQNQRVIFLNGADNVTISNSKFWGGDIRYANAIYILGDVENVNIENNRVHYYNRGVYVAGQTRNLTIQNNRFDGGWYTGIPLITGTATFTKPTDGALTATNGYLSGDQQKVVLNDANANFLDPSLELSMHATLRLLIPRSSGTSFSGIDGNTIKIAAPNARSGDWLRTSSGKFAIVESVISDGVVVEEWLNDNNRMPTSSPAIDDDWTLYHTVIGQVWGGKSDTWDYTEGTEPTDVSSWATCPVSKTSICTNPRHGWRDMDAVANIPADGIRYELSPRGEYQVFFAKGSTGIKILNNDFRRTWGDSIGSGSITPLLSDSLFKGNVIKAGQDMGITIEGYSNATVEDNTIIDTGASGIAVWDSINTTVRNNTIRGGGWQGQGSTGVSLLKIGTTVDNTKIYNTNWDPITSIGAQTGSAVRASSSVTNTYITGTIVPVGRNGIVLVGSGVQNTTIDEPSSLIVLKMNGAN